MSHKARWGPLWLALSLPLSHYVPLPPGHSYLQSPRPAARGLGVSLAHALSQAISNLGQ